MGNRKTRDDGYAAPNQLPGKTTVERRKVGPADPATRRAALNARLNEREPKAQPVKVKAAPNPTKDLSILGAADKLKTRGLVIDKAVDDAV